MPLCTNPLLTNQLMSLHKATTLSYMIYYAHILLLGRTAIIIVYIIFLKFSTLHDVDTNQEISDGIYFALPKITRKTNSTQACINIFLLVLYMLLICTIIMLSLVDCLLEAEIHKPKTGFLILELNKNVLNQP